MEVPEENVEIPPSILDAVLTARSDDQKYDAYKAVEPYIAQLDLPEKNRRAFALYWGDRFARPDEVADQIGVGSAATVRRLIKIVLTTLEDIRASYDSADCLRIESAHTTQQSNEPKQPLMQPREVVHTFLFTQNPTTAQEMFCALEQLPIFSSLLPTEQQLLRMKYGEQRSMREVAELIDDTEDFVKKAIYTARDKLRIAMNIPEQHKLSRRRNEAA